MEPITTIDQFTEAKREFGHALFKIRVSNRATQKEIAALLLNESRGSIANQERGGAVGVMSKAGFLVICKHFKVSDSQYQEIEEIRAALEDSPQCRSRRVLKVGRYPIHSYEGVSEDVAAFARWLKYNRIVQRYSQSVLADMINVPVGRIAAIEAGEEPPLVDTEIEEVCQFFGINSIVPMELAKKSRQVCVEGVSTNKDFPLLVLESADHLEYLKPKDEYIHLCNKKSPTNPKPAFIWKVERISELCKAIGNYGEHEAWDLVLEISTLDSKNIKTCETIASWCQELISIIESIKY
jgi:hypothetical protein